VAVVLFFAMGGCTPVAGGAALIGLVAVGALTSRCYDYLDVTVLDADGRRTCAATVTATKGSSRLELSSCYYAPLTDGHWLLRASLPGFPDALSSVNVDHEHDCTRYVQSVELTLKRAGAPRPPAVASPPVALPPPATSAAPAIPSASAPPATELHPPPEPAPPPSALPANSAAPPVGVFPDR
jgi:hypothetical protein